MRKATRRLGIATGVLVILVIAGYFALEYGLGRALESKGIRNLLAGKTAKVLGCDAGYLPLTSDGFSVFCRGFLGQASPPRALTELRASSLRARCSPAELWRAKWRIDHLGVDHLQAAYGEAAAQHISRNEFPKPPLVPPSRTDSPLELDIRVLDVTNLDLFWGTTPETGGEFRHVHTQFFPREHNLVIHADGGTFHQTKWPVAQVDEVKLFYAKPDLRVDEGRLSFAGQGSINVTGNFRFEESPSLDLQLIFVQCPTAPFFPNQEKAKLEGVFDATAHLQKDASQTESARATGAIQVSKAILKNIQSLQNAAEFTGRKELGRMPIKQIKGDYDWNWPSLTVKNFVLESSELVVLEGEFTVRQQRIDGEFRLGVSPDLVDKFPGAREEVFKRSERGYLWTDITLAGSIDNPRDNLKPRLVRAAQNHFAKGLLAPLFKPGQTVIEAIEAL